MENSEVHVSSYDSSSGRSLHHVMLPTDEVSIKEQLKLCCKPTYKIRRIKSKGAILVLIWNFLALFVLWYASSTFYRTHVPNNNMVISLIPFAIMLPLAGWLADAYIGRYRVICCSILVTWAAVMLETLSTVVAIILDENNTLWNVLTQALLGLMAGIGLGGFLSTVMQFGTDQLNDASTDEISAFIVWLMWTCSAPLFIMNLTFVYLPFNNGHYILLGNLILCVNLTVIMIMLFCCNHWLIKEPTLQNPFKLIYQVSKYALKHKHPQYRSAFTYSDDEVLSRIDYGKSKYGGPFTTEQVEDVKTFYKILPMIILGGLLAGEIVAGKLLDSYLKHQFIFVSHPHAISELINESVSSIVSYSIPVLIVLHEVLVYPAFHRCCPWVTSLHRFFMGALVQIGMFLAFMIFELLSRQNYLKENGHNSTVECMLQYDQAITTSFMYNWIVIPEALFAISVSLMGIGGLKFIAAQVPYSMKGVLVGVGFCSVTVTAALNYLSVTVIISPFKQKLSHSNWNTKIINCGFWFELLHIIICLLGCIASVLIIKWYKKRKREDILPNEHFYAERYYSNLLEHRS